MSDLREHLHELADAGARHATVAGPAAAIRRGRQRRRRIAGAVAAILALVVAVGTGSLGRLVQPDLPTITPPTLLPVPKLEITTPGFAAGTREAVAFDTLVAQVRRCPGGIGSPDMVAYFRSAEFRRMVMVAAKRPGLGETTVCWAATVFGDDGKAEVLGAVRPMSTALPLTATSGGSSNVGVVQGQTAKDAVLVRVRFRDRPAPIDLPVIQSRPTYLVNLYVGIFPPGWTPVEVTAYDANGRQVAGCALDPSAAPLPNCPGG